MSVEPLEEYLDEPFERIEEQIHEDILARLDRMAIKLDDMEAELENLIEQSKMSVH